jgi:phosphatidylserine decarboxylase
VIIDRAGLPFIIAALAPGAVLVLVGRSWWGAPFLLLAAFFAFFFRDPERRPPPGKNLVVAPADGRVMWAGPAAAAAPAGPWQQVTIFLSPMDVHINRVPAGGRVTQVDFRAGAFLPAYRPESARNEQTEVWVEHDGQPIVFRQVVGVLARRVVCRLQSGQEVQTGQRFGLMKFGSRMDVFLPEHARLRVRTGDRVRGGETVIAEL